jgi:hypothetical protein
VKTAETRRGWPNGFVSPGRLIASLDGLLPEDLRDIVEHGENGLGVVGWLPGDVPVRLRRTICVAPVVPFCAEKRRLVWVGGDAMKEGGSRVLELCPAPYPLEADTYCDPIRGAAIVGQKLQDAKRFAVVCVRSTRTRKVVLPHANLRLGLKANPGIK